MKLSLYTRDTAPHGNILGYKGAFILHNLDRCDNYVLEDCLMTQNLAIIVQNVKCQHACRNFE